MGWTIVGKMTGYGLLSCTLEKEGTNELERKKL